MAKKSFKKGLGSLIQDTRIKENKNFVSQSDKVNDNISEGADEFINMLQNKIEKLNLELKKWRTGQLTKTVFDRSIKEFNLQYNSNTNEFELID